MTPQDLLKAFEDKKLGHDCQRHHGKVEKGSGSRFSRMHPEDQQRHAALEEMIETDAAVSRAQEALRVAEARHEAVAKRAGVELHTDELEA